MTSPILSLPSNKVAADKRVVPPQFNLSDTTPWDRAVEFGEGPFKCGADVLGKSRVLRLALSGPRHWEPLCNLILRTRSGAQVYYAAVRELHVRDLKPVPRPSVPDYGITYALLSVWSESFQVRITVRETYMKGIICALASAQCWAPRIVLLKT